MMQTAAKAVLAMIVGFFVGMSCVMLCQLWRPGQPAAQPAINAIQTLHRVNHQSWAQLARSEARAMGAAKAALHGQAPGIGAKAMSALRFAAQDGARVGCRGSLACVKAVGLFFGTQTGKTEEAATAIAEAAGVEATSVDDIGAGDLAGYDGIIAGVPTWHTGADEQRSGTAWDDYLDEIRALDLNGKPCAVFGMGDQAGYGDNYCDAIEELHNTFQAAGAKMLGYTDASGYEMYTESKSVQDGKFLGLPLDNDNEPDMTEGRAKAWVDQLKSEGMPLR
jgi:flavodoxin I